MPPEHDPHDQLLDRRQAIGRHIQHLRMRANLTQEGLRDLTGVDRITIQRIEAGTTDARLSWLLRIADALDTPLSELLRE